MALLFSDGFDNYVANTDMTPVGYGTTLNSGTVSVDATGSRWSTPALRLNTGAAATNQPVINSYPFTVLANSLRVAFWVKTSAASFGTSFPLRFVNSNLTPTRYWNFVPLANGSMGVSLMSSTATQAAAISGAIAINDGFWHHIEAFLIAGTTGGSLELWIDGLSQGSISGATATAAMSATELNRVQFNGINLISGQFSFDDVVIWDDSGTDFTSWMGPHRTRVLRPTAPGDTTQFTPSSGANWSTVDEQVYSSTDYNEASTPGATDLYNYSDMSPLPSTIRGVAVRSVVFNPDVGTKTFRAVAKSGTVIGNGATMTASVSPTMHTQAFGKNPETGGNWTGTEVNNAQFGIQVVS